LLISEETVDAQETGKSCANFMRGGYALASRITGAVD
jgi:hypothetical protein